MTGPRGPEGFQTRLDEAARALAKFAEEGGLDPSPDPRERAPSPSEAKVRAALAEAAERIRVLQAELRSARQGVLENTVENRRLAAELMSLRSAADEAEARAVPLRERAALLAAECLRLESLRRKADSEAADAEASQRAVAEGLRREVREAKAAADRALAEAGAKEARARLEVETLSKRLVDAVGRLQGLEREKKLEAARGAGDASALQSELERARAAAAALRQEVQSVRDSAAAALKSEVSAAREAAARRDSALRAELAAALQSLEDIRAAYDARGRELERGQGVAAALRAELKAARDEADRSEAALREELRAAQAALRAFPPARAPDPAHELSPGLPPWSEDPPLAETYLQPSLEPVLDPSWARLLRLVRPPVEAAYAHLRRLSITSLTAGQKALLRLAAASIASATDSLASVELSLDEGPAPAAPSGVVPILEASVAAWEPSFRRRGASLAREWSGPLPDAAHDPKALRVLIHHALRNALEAVTQGGHVAVRASRGAHGGLALEFIDDGPGFPRAWLERRFEPFASPRPGHAGLGLAVVRRTMRRWGGDAEAFNEPSRGARLVLTFPAPSPELSPSV